jgi:hypothetical protein
MQSQLEAAIEKLTRLLMGRPARKESILYIQGGQGSKHKLSIQPIAKTENRICINQNS